MVEENEAKTEKRKGVQCVYERRGRLICWTWTQI